MFYQVLINCPEIKSINITNANNPVKLYKISNPITNRFSNITYYQYSILNNKSNCIVIKDTNNKINVSVIVNENWEITNNIDDEKLYYSFPLVGSQLLQLPFYLNSPKLIPTSQNDGILLKSKICNDDENASIEINKSVLMKSLILYEQLLSLLNDQNCPNIEEMVRGLSIPVSPFESFDFNWYNDVIITRMKDILLKNIKIKTFSNSIVPLKDAIFASENVADDKLDEFIYFVDQCLHNNIANKEYCSKWRNKIKDKIKTITIEELIAAIKNYKSLFNDPTLKFFNDFLGFIWKYDKNLLYNNQIIPDMNNKLHNIPKEDEEDFRISKGVSDQIIEMMEFISIPWKSTHMNSAIHTIRFSEDKKTDAQNAIIEKTKNENNFCFDLMKYVLEDNDFRKDMFEIVVDFKERNFDKYVAIQDIDPSIWNFADSYVLNEIIKVISAFDQNKISNNMSYIKKFILVFIKYNQSNPKIIYSTKIIPNAKCHLKSLDELSNKIEVPNNSIDLHDYLNKIFIENNLNVDFDERIIHPQIFDDDIKSKRNETVSDFIYEINSKLNSKNVKNDIKVNIAKSIISLIPENKDNFKSRSSQNELFELCIHFFKLDKHIINDRFYDDYKWEKSNQVIISYICEEISKLKSYSKFLNEIQSYTQFMDNSNKKPNNKKKQKNINQDKGFSLLNLIYKYADKYDILGNYEILPCLNGSFKKKFCLKQNPGIDEELLKCIQSLDPESKIQEAIVDHRVKVENLNEINFLEFYQNMNKMFMNAVERKDIDAIQMIFELNKINDPSFFDKIKNHVMSKDEECKLNILIEAHVNFLKNYLRESDFNSESGKKRWPFELIQNANDTVQATNRKVKITFEFYDNKLIFSHDGEPFQNNTLLGLLYQCSSGKNNKKTTGKFGTGFLSTLIVSREIHLSGDLEGNSESDTINTGFDVRIVRNGSTSDELKKGIREMENSFIKGRPKKGLTKFEYIYPNYRDENHKNVIETGLKSLKNNLSTVLVLNPSIESVTIKTNDETIIYKLDNNDGNREMIYDKVIVETVSITSNSSNSKEKYFVINSIEKVNNSKIHQFINTSIQKEEYPNYDVNNNQYNEDIDKQENEPYNIEMNNNDESDQYFDIHINCLIRLNNKTNAIEVNYGSNFLSSYPLFGIYKINSPFIINSRDFELERERQYLLLLVNETKFGKKESLINQFIISKSADLYEQIIKKSSEEKCLDLFNLFRNLNDTAISYNHDFVNRNFAYKIREFVNIYPLFDTGSELKKFNEVVIPYEINHKNLYDEFYELVSKFKSESYHIVAYEYCKKWEEILWNGSNSVLTFNKFFDFISSKGNIREFKFGSEIEYIKKLIDFICKITNNEQIFRRKRVLINQSGDLRNLDEIDHIKLPDILYKILDSIGYNYQCRILHPEISFLYEKFHFKQFGIYEFVGVCVNNLNDNNAPKFMQFVVESDKNRELMYKYTKILIDPNLECIKLQNDDTTRSIMNIFTKADTIVCKIFIRKIFEFDFEFLKNNINFAEFIALIKSHLTIAEFGTAGLEKLLFQKCLSDCEKELNNCGKYYDIECVLKEKIELRDFITNEKYNFRAMGQNDNEYYYFMVRQSEYFTFQNFNYSQNSANSNGHYVLFIVFNAEREQPDLWKLESIK